jgi:pimeloyl-ACP methyl ester carboxylesterase
MDERPAVLLVPGFLGSPPMYGRMADRLLARGAAAVTVAPIWTPDWMLTVAIGYRRVLARTAHAVVRAWRGGGRRPLIVVGHSAGGVVARMATSQHPSPGGRAGLAEAFGALVTLGTPHRMAESAASRMGAGYEAGRILHLTAPGAWLAPRTGYLTVGSRFIAGAVGGDADPWRRLAGGFYAQIGGEAARTAWGDGLIPEAATDLDGSRHVTLEGIIHAQGLPAPWYGSDEGLDGWWDLAVETWREALAARRSAREGTGESAG